MARRARIVLAAASGSDNKAICLEVGVDANTVGKWRRRFAAHRLDGLLDEPRPGTPRKIGDDEIADTIRRTLETRPPGATHWSLRSMAKTVGYAPSTIHRIWRAFGLQPHRTETFESFFSNDPLFVEKVRDIVGLYLRRLNGPSCSASMKSRRSRRWTVRNLCCRCTDQVKSSSAPATIPAMAQRLFLPLWTSLPAQSSDAAIQNIAQASLGNS